MLSIRADQYINCSADDVYRQVCENYFTFQPVWDPAILAMRAASDRPIAVGSEAEISRLFRNKTESGRSTVTDLVAGTSITVLNCYPRSSETRLISCQQLNAGGTRLHVEISYTLHSLARLVAPLSANLLERALAISLRSAKLELEKGIHADEAS